MPLENRVALMFGWLFTFLGAVMLIYWLTESLIWLNAWMGWGLGPFWLWLGAMTVGVGIIMWMWERSE